MKRRIVVHDGTVLGFAKTEEETAEIAKSFYGHGGEDLFLLVYELTYIGTVGIMMDYETKEPADG